MKPHTPRYPFALGGALVVVLGLSACNATVPKADSGGLAGVGKAAGDFFDKLVSQSPTGAGPGSAASLTSGAAGPSRSSASGPTMVALAKDSSSPERKGVADAGAKSSGHAKLDPEEIKRMLVRADPAACSATQDASAVEMLETWSKLAGAGLGSLVDAKLSSDKKALQAKLDELKPVMRQLARNTTWLPHSAERVIGEKIAEFNKLTPYKPKNAELKAVVANVITPIFEDLQRYAKEDLGTEMEFEMRLYDDPRTQAPKMISGGILLVPSGMITALGSVKKPDVLVAFLFAHEFSHALRRHTTKKVQMTLIDSVMLVREFQQLYDTEKSAWERLRGGLAANFQFKAKSVASLVDTACKAKSWIPLMEQSQEYEADVCGAMLLDRAGKSRGKVFSPVEGFTQYVEAGLATRSGQARSEKLPKFLQRCLIDADHPSAEDRQANLLTYTTSLKAGRGVSATIELTPVSTHAEPKRPAR